MAGKGVARRATPLPAKVYGRNATQNSAVEFTLI
jgi:hypothetical protein